MIMTPVHRTIAFLFFFIFILACKKEAAAPPTVNPASPQGNYSGTKLVISKTEKLGSPWAEISPDTVYTSYSIGSGLFRNFPAGFDDRINSFFLPKGHMAVFATNQDGTGESACFVARDGDVKANLPARLRNGISYIRYIRLNETGKKGTGSVNEAAVKSYGTQWYYGWSINKSSFPGQQFVPMTWGKGACNDDNVKYLAERPDVDHLLSFNEPDNTSQSNIPNIDTAVQRYIIMQKSGLRLGSPVVTQDQAFGTGKWLTNFMAAASARKLRIDFIAVHWYDWGNQANNAATDSLTAERVFNRFVAYIEKVRMAYPTLPIWVTEYNANPNRSSTVIHRYFMKLSAEWMNSVPYIERYAYFFPGTVPGANADGTLTPEGAYWKSLPSPGSLSGNILWDADLVN